MKELEYNRWNNHSTLGITHSVSIPIQTTDIAYLTLPTHSYTHACIHFKKALVRVYLLRNLFETPFCYAQSKTTPPVI